MRQHEFQKPDGSSLRELAEEFTTLTPEQDKSRLDRGLAEAMAAYAHEAWSGWMKYLFSKSPSHTHRREDGEPTTGALIPESLVERWTRQMETPYFELPEAEKTSDRDEARKILEIFRKHTVVGADAKHASAPEGLQCVDCTIDAEPCPACYRAAWERRHPYAVSPTAKAE